MYGYGDNYGAPGSQAADLDELFGEDDDFESIDLRIAELDAEEDDDEDDDEAFGGGILGRGSILGIAVTDKAKRNRMNRILGNLKQYWEQGKLDKARRYAKALGRIDPIKKKKDGWITPEVQAWLDFAETGDVAELSEALHALGWTGDEIEQDDDTEQEGEVYDASGTVIHRHRGRGRGLPPGFRPVGYTLWTPRRKIAWLNHHPRAASIRLPVDPGGYVVRPVRAGRPVVAPRRGPAPRRTNARGGLVGTGALKRQAQIAAARAAGRTAGRRAARARMAGLDAAIEEGVQEFGALIGSNAFLPLQGRGDELLPHDALLEDEIDDDLTEMDEMDQADREDFGAYIPQFGAVFKRDLDARLEAARRKYERLRAKSGDTPETKQAYSQYLSLVRAYKEASELPSAQHAGPSLAHSWGQQQTQEEAEEAFSLSGGKDFSLGGGTGE